MWSKNVPLSASVIQEKAVILPNNWTLKTFRLQMAGIDAGRKEIIYHWRLFPGSRNLSRQKWLMRGQKHPFQLFLSNYDLKDIYNANKFGLSYQCFPKKIYQLKSEKCYGGKLSKIRITDMTAEMLWAKVTQVCHWEGQESKILQKCQVFATEINGKVEWMGNCLKSGSKSWTGRLLLKEEMLLLW